MICRIDTKTADCLIEHAALLNGQILNRQSKFQILLFTNECTSVRLKNNIKIYIKIGGVSGK